MDSLSSSSSMTKKNTKLSIRNKTRFKNTNLLLREKTILKKALELSVLCDNEICVIHYDREGNLVNTYPEDQRQVKDILERYNSLSDGEKLKKNTNLSQFFNKKLVDEKRRALTDADERKKFTKKVGEFKGSLVGQLQMLKDMVRDLLYTQDHHHHQTTTEPDQSPCLDVMSEQNHNFPASSSGFFFPNELSDPWKNFGPHDLDQQQQETGSFMNLLTSGDHVSSITDQYFLSTASSSTFNHQSKFSVFSV